MLSKHTKGLISYSEFIILKQLSVLNKYFWKYRFRFILGIVFIVISNYFGILAPQITGFIVDNVAAVTSKINPGSSEKSFYDPLVVWIIGFMKNGMSFSKMILLSGIVLLILALLRGFFMYLMRQTIIVMSRHIEYDQKNEIFNHYQILDASFYKTHSTGDLMSRMSEDVSRVRMYTGPSIMYLINLTALIGLSLFYMFSKNWELSLYVLSPLPFLAVFIYYVNTIIIKRSEHIQSQLSDLTSNAQESYSGIRVIKTFVQESSMAKYFGVNSEKYRKSAIGLAGIEALYYPSIGLLIGLSTLLTIYIGGRYQIQHTISAGTIAEFVVYINMLTFPVSALGWVASMIQRAISSQKRINEFLLTSSQLKVKQQTKHSIQGNISFKNVYFTYEHTGIQALKGVNLDIKSGQKIAIIGKTGSGKSTLGYLLLRFFDPDSGDILIDGIPVSDYDLKDLRRQIGYISQDVFLFSDTVLNNIAFGPEDIGLEKITEAAFQASVLDEIKSLTQGFNTKVGERGVTLSGGQKQRISIARALAKPTGVLIFDDCLSAVDARTENEIISRLTTALAGKTAIIITHRIFSLLQFDQIVVIEDGMITEKGTHSELMYLNGYYAQLYHKQQNTHPEG